MMQLLRYVAWAAIAALAIAVAATVVLRPQDGIGNVKLPGAATIGGAFELTAQDGRRFSSASLKGRPYGIFFGFTNCPDVCPTKLNDLTGLLGELKADADKVAMLFVTVDPERDTAALLKDYLRPFDPRIIGLTGSVDDIAGIVKSYRIFAKKVPTAGSYTYDHTALVFLFDRTGQLASTLSPDEAQDVQLKKLRALIAR